MNFHYEFNMRHLTNVFEGLLKADPNSVTHGTHLVYLWLHESERVYGDRLVSQRLIGESRRQEILSPCLLIYSINE